MDYIRVIPVIGYLLAGMLVWAAAFTATYAGVAFICARDLADMAVFGIAILPFLLGTVTLAALAATGLMVLVAYRRWPRTGEEAELPAFVRTMSLIVALLAIVGIVWNGAPALFFAGCA
jgi:hypothetical protein